MATLENLEKRMDSRLDELTSTIEDLAISVKEGFDRMVTKEHFDTEISGVKRRLDIIENISVGGHERRIENLEDDVRTLKTKTGIK